MQRTYFLGGASPQGFETRFWDSQRAAYGFYLKGGPGTGKSTLMKRIAAAFAAEPVSVYHCASDPHSLDAVVLESRGIFIADATAPHESSTPLPFVTGETVDLAAGLDAGSLHKDAEAILALYQENQNAHKQVRKGLSGIAEMTGIIAETGAAALDRDKLAKYAQRLAKRLLPKAAGLGEIQYRQSCAVTPLGRLRFIPEGFDLVLVQDAMYTAGTELLRMLAETAVQCGQVCEVSVSLTQQHAPVMVILPMQKLVLAAAESTLPEVPKPVTVIRMQRFYDAEKLRDQRTLLRFCAKTAAATEEQVIELLAEALRVHDELERYYIGALNTAFLDQKAAEIIEKIMQADNARTNSVEKR